MTTLLLELRGPMQSWGSSSRFATRSTDAAPTRSGVIGLLAAALGVARTESLTQFEELRFGVRIDQPGKLERDYQTAMDLDGKSPSRLSTRFYLADAVFVAALEHPDRTEVERFRDAIHAPVFAPYLGRRAFPPAGPIRTRLVEAPLAEALAAEPWRAAPRVKEATKTATTWLESRFDANPGDVDVELIRDAPLSFDPRRREYAIRAVRVAEIEVVNDLFERPGNGPQEETKRELLDEHDPMNTLADLT